MYRYNCTIVLLDYCIRVKIIHHKLHKQSLVKIIRPGARQVQHVADCDPIELVQRYHALLSLPEPWLIVRNGFFFFSGNSNNACCVSAMS